MSPRSSDAAERVPAKPEAPGPIATIVSATLLGIAGAVAVVVLDSTLADVVGYAALACGLAATTWAALRLAADSDASD
jgi:hypothetical protein